MLPLRTTESAFRSAALVTDPASTSEHARGGQAGLSAFPPCFPLGETRRSRGRNPGSGSTLPQGDLPVGQGPRKPVQHFGRKESACLVGQISCMNWRVPPPL